MLRDLNQTRDGKRILDTPYVGTLGSQVPTAGPPYALALNDVIANNLQNNYVRVWVTSHNFPAGFFVNTDTSANAPNMTDGLYWADGYLIIDDVDVLDAVNPGQPYRLLTLTEGNLGMSTTLGLTISSVPNITASVLVASIITAAAALSVQSVPALNVQAGSTQAITAAAALSVQSVPSLTASATMGGTWNATADLLITCVPLLHASTFVGFELPSIISPSRTATVDLDSDATHPAAVFVKDPQAVLDYGMDITTWLADAQDSLMDFTVTPTTGSDVTVHVTGLVNGLMSAMIGGGTPGLANSVLFDFTTAAGRRDQRTIYFQVEER